jgi:hypothetical protein
VAKQAGCNIQAGWTVSVCQKYFMYISLKALEIKGGHAFDGKASFNALMARFYKL